MPFELFNILASFQDYINKILVKKLKLFVIIYLDDIFIYIKDASKGYIKAIGLVLDVLQKHGFFANLKKCQLHKDKIYFLSNVMLAQKVKIEDKPIKAVQN